jgi:hypothetical protein
VLVLVKGQSSIWKPQRWWHRVTVGLSALLPQPLSWSTSSHRSLLLLCIQIFWKPETSRTGHYTWVQEVTSHLSFKSHDVQDWWGFYHWKSEGGIAFPVGSFSGKSFAKRRKMSDWNSFIV